MRTPFFLIFGIVILLSCQTNKTSTNFVKDHSIATGTWTMDMLINEDKTIPFKFEVTSDTSIFIVNHTERIAVTDVSYFSDSIHFSMPRFDSEFIGKIDTPESISGIWYNHLKGDYSIPFSAKKILSETNISIPEGTQKKYKVVFSPDAEDSYPAIGLFNINKDISSGTFITETGDYRFLEGTITDTSFKLSCFDGSHLFLFEGELNGDNIINGKFYSGNHWQEPWVAELSENFELSDADSLTFLKEGTEFIEFDVKNSADEKVVFNKEDYINKVSIIQIFGSWCPNCHDENVFYKTLHDLHHAEGLQIIPVAFEAGDTFKQQAAYVHKQFEEIGIDYPFYIGGSLKKDAASAKFHMLNKVMSYPTSIFIDKKGMVRKIHTGFYGPSTGSYYTDYVNETKSFVEDLLKE